MKAVRLYGVADLRVEMIDPPQPPGPGEVTLAVAAAGICGSDLHNFRTGAWITRAPSVAGHEFTGRVTAVGSEVDHVSIGQRVLVDSRHICGTCPACRQGRGQVCENLGFIGESIDGGFAEAVTLPARNVFSAPEGVPDRHLALAEPLAVALHALRRLSAPPGAGIAVIGCGPIGGFVALLAAREGRLVQVVDQNDRRAALVAEATGAEVVDLASLAETAPGFVVETTGNEAVIETVVGAMAGCGTLALVGIGQAARVLDPVTLVERELSVFGCHSFTDADLRDIGVLLPVLSPALEPFIAERIPLDAVPDAYARHIAREVDGLKSIILCGTDPDE